MIILIEGGEKVINPLQTVFAQTQSSVPANKTECPAEDFSAVIQRLVSRSNAVKTKSVDSEKALKHTKNEKVEEKTRSDESEVDILKYDESSQEEVLTFWEIESADADSVAVERDSEESIPTEPCGTYITVLNILPFKNAEALHPGETEPIQAEGFPHVKTTVTTHIGQCIRSDLIVETKPVSLEEAQVSSKSTFADIPKSVLQAETVAIPIEHGDIMPLSNTGDEKVQIETSAPAENSIDFERPSIDQTVPIVGQSESEREATYIPTDTQESILFKDLKAKDTTLNRTEPAMGEQSPTRVEYAQDRAALVHNNHPYENHPISEMPETVIENADESSSRAVSQIAADFVKDGLFLSDGKAYGVATKLDNPTSDQVELDGVNSLNMIQAVNLQLHRAEAVQNQSGAPLMAQPTELPVFDQITDSVRISLQGGKSTFSMKLKPEGLGELSVKMTMEDGNVFLELNTSLPSTKAMITSQLGELRQALELNSVRVSDFSVSCSHDFEADVPAGVSLNLSAAQQRFSFNSFRERPNSNSEGQSGYDFHNSSQTENMNRVTYNPSFIRGILNCKI